MNLEPTDTNSSEIENKVPRKVWVKPVVEAIEFLDTSFVGVGGADAASVGSH